MKRCDNLFVRESDQTLWRVPYSPCEETEQLVTLTDFRRYSGRCFLLGLALGAAMAGVAAVVLWLLAK